MLEELHIDDRISSEAHVLNISIPSLRKLKLVFCYLMDKIIIDTPNLQYLDYVNCIDEEILVKNLNSLVEARVMIGFRELARRSKKLSLLFSSLIDGITSAKSLMLGGVFIKDFWFRGWSLPVFESLTHLGLGLINLTDVGLFIFILDAAPTLECLVLDLAYIHRDASNLSSIDYRGILLFVSLNTSPNLKLNLTMTVRLILS